MSCARCAKQGELACPHCERRYCCKRCLHIDTHYGTHVHGAALEALPLATITDPVLRKCSKPGPPRYAQTCPAYATYALPSEPAQCAIQLGHGPDASQLGFHRKACLHSPLVQPLAYATAGEPLALTAHLPESVYLHLGEDIYESPHVISTIPFQARYPSVGLGEVARAVGRGLGCLHMELGSDTYGFGLTWSSGAPQLHLDVLHTNKLDPDTPESIQAFGSVMGLSPYVPRADQKELFQAFCEGYAEVAGVARTREVAEVMKSYLS